MYRAPYRVVCIAIQLLQLLCIVHRTVRGVSRYNYYICYVSCTVPCGVYRDTTITVVMYRAPYREGCIAIQLLHLLCIVHRTVWCVSRYNYYSCYVSCTVPCGVYRDTTIKGIMYRAPYRAVCIAIHRRCTRHLPFLQFRCRIATQTEFNIATPSQDTTIATDNMTSLLCLFEAQNH